MKNNPVICIYKGVQVRKYNKATIMMGEVQFKKLIDEVDRTGMSIPKVLAHSSTPCNHCKDMMVTVFDKNGSIQKVKRGILSLHIPEGNGMNIIEKANAESIKSCTPNP